MCSNCDNLINADKSAQLHGLINYHNVTIILVQRSRLSTDVSSCTVFLKGSKPVRRGRVKGNCSIA